MTEQAYNEALADLRKWHEGDRFQKHFNKIEAHVKALSALTEVKSLPPPTSILLTRDATGRLHDPTTGEPFTVVIDTLDGRKEVTHITFQGERDVPIKLPDPVYVDPESAPVTIDGLPVVLSDEPLLTTVHPDVSPVTPDEPASDEQEEDGDEDDTPDESAPTDIATSADAVPAAPPARKSKKKRG